MASGVGAVWADVLGLQQVGLDEPFFALGGDSVLATVIIGRLREALDTAGISVRAIFAAPTVGGTAARLLSEEDVPGRLERVARVCLEVEALSAEDLERELLDTP